MLYTKEFCYRANYESNIKYQISNIQYLNEIKLRLKIKSYLNFLYDSFFNFFYYIFINIKRKKLKHIVNFFNKYVKKKKILYVKNFFPFFYLKTKIVFLEVHLLHI